MNNNPAFVSSFLRQARTTSTTKEANRAYSPVVSANLLVNLNGEKNRAPIPMENPASIMLLPIASPSAISYCFFLIAVKSTASSGRDVPMAITKKLMKYSGTYKDADITMTD